MRVNIKIIQLVLYNVLSRNQKNKSSWYMMLTKVVISAEIQPLSRYMGHSALDMDKLNVKYGRKGDPTTVVHE